MRAGAVRVGPLRVGTRASALALWQARWVADVLETRGVAVEVVEIATVGDRGQGVGDKARWTSELERALLEQRIDVAVHSAKDVPGELADGTLLAAIPLREDASDVICGAGSLEELAPGTRVGTGSIRRAAQIRALRDDLEIVELRGNVDTRLRKLEEGHADAIVLAAAGVRRLGRSDAIGGVLGGLIPAPGQGALILQTRADDQSTIAAIQPLADAVAQACVLAERAFASALEATCNTPLGASALPVGEHTRLRAGEHTQLPVTGQIRLRAWLGLPDGSHWIADELSGPADEVGEALAQRMISVGARELLAQAEAMAAA
jgi:hydroxymethylbilane synthase